MIKIYGMPNCPNTAFVLEQVKGNDKFEFINIGEGPANLKEFLKIRDNSPIYDDVKKNGGIGLPTFLLEDGTVTRSAEAVGLKSKTE